jgi:phosphoribosyl-ATP pyrophosphohydrolase
MAILRLIGFDLMTKEEYQSGFNTINSEWLWGFNFTSETTNIYASIPSFYQVATAKDKDSGYGTPGYGTTCHKGTDTCWAEENTLNPILFLSELQDFINKRHEEMPEGSYTTSLFKKGVNKMAQKVGEEAVETIIEATNGNNEKLIYESSDLLYHLIVLLTSKGLRIEDVVKELQMRHDPEWDKKRRVAKSKGEMK